MRVPTIMLVAIVAGSLVFAYVAVVPPVQLPTRPEPVPIQARVPSGRDPAAPVQGGTNKFVPFPSTAQFETADSWIADGKRYRLYGLQACLRGTSVTIAPGAKRDCGELNLIMAQAVVRDSKPVCTTIRELDAYNLLVVCRTTTGKTGYDLATYMIAQGWGFAAVSSTGELAVPGYRIVEQGAREAREGLWAYSDLPHPAAILLRKDQQQPSRNAAGEQ
ncbi:thermonuclease family protein [Mesorhizobium sp. GR13]|uniref:thermonuclease family protein n=1 Tax=Mesorhizobium sp. GR13 TaxID=2562308 RepID=UPI0010C04DF7|nr:thermonuclease family protein [Mesorhizobium sp. GR13]